MYHLIHKGQGSPELLISPRGTNELGANRISIARSGAVHPTRGRSLHDEPRGRAVAFVRVALLAAASTVRESVVGPMIQKMFDARLASMTAPGMKAVPQDRVDVATDALSNSRRVMRMPESVRSLLGT